MYRTTLVICSIFTLLAIGRCTNSVEETAIEQTETIEAKNKTADGFTIYENFKIIDGVSVDSVLENNSNLVVEEVLTFKRPADEPFIDSVFSPDQWNLMYADPRVFIGQFAYVVFGSTQICIATSHIGICDSCIDTNKITQLQFDFFDGPYVMPDEPGYETWKIETPLHSSFGGLKIESRPAFCYDTGCSSFNLTNESGTIKTLKEWQNLIYFEADVDKDTHNEGYLIVYGVCGVWMNIYRITESL